MNRPFQPSHAAAAAPIALPSHEPDGSPRWALALWSIVAFWSVYFVIATARAAIAGLPAQDEMLLRRFCVTLIAVGLTWILYMLLRRFEHLSTPRLLAVSFAASVPLALAYASVNYVAFYHFPIPEHIAMDSEHPWKEPMTPLASIVSSALEWYFFIAAWAVMGVALISSAKAREAQHQAALFAKAASDAEIRALRYQVNPHFLFNTLNALSSLVMRDRRDEAEQMILNLSTFFRESLTRDATDDIPLAEEIRLQRLYLDIEAVRFPDRLKVRIHVPDPLATAQVPALILQPIVENAIKYGVSRSQQPVTLLIGAEAIGDRLELTVADDAPHAPVGIDDHGTGVGLANVRARLAARFGDDARMIAGPALGGGWVVRLGMPLVRD